VTVLLHPYIPEAAGKLLAALGEEELALEAAAFGTRPGGGAVSQVPPLFPKPQ
jgi:methionyl-tRNA synthetase